LKLQQSEGNADESQTFSDEEIIHEYATFFFAGTDTTTNLIDMAGYLLT